MSRVYLAAAFGCLLIAFAFALPCLTFAELGAVSLPYPDPTPEMLQQQMADIAALERQLLIHIAIGIVLFAAGTAILVRLWRRRRAQSAPKA